MMAETERGRDQIQLISEDNAHSDVNDLVYLCWMESVLSDKQHTRIGEALLAKVYDDASEDRDGHVPPGPLFLGLSCVRVCLLH
jgi:hypothetical protein